MAKNLFKKSLSVMLAVLMCIGAVSINAFAEENNTPTHLLGDAEGDLATFNFKVVDEYIPAADDDRYAVVGSGEQTEFWTAYLYKAGNSDETPVATIGDQNYYLRGDGRNINGIYKNGEFYSKEDLGVTKLQAAYNGLQQAMLMNGSGKKVAVYCADHVVSTTTEARYTVANIEDATHFDEETAGKIRAVAANGYWGGTETVNQYGTLAKMKSWMAASGFSQDEINLLSPGVALSATQFAIWELANENDDRQVVNVQYIVKNRVAGYNGASWNKLVLTPQSEIPCVDLIFKLSNALVNLDPIPATEMTTGNTVLTDKVILKDVAIDVLYKADGHANNDDSDNDNDAFVTNVTFDVLETSEKDDLTAKIVDEEGTVYAIGRIAGTPEAGEITLVNNGNNTYTFPNITLVENEETTYSVVVSGAQYLERNVYLYTAGERGVSQTLIGYDEGEFTVDVESSVKQIFNVEDPTVTFEPGQASNISFMLIDKATGAIEFLYKIDIENETSFEIPFEADKVTAVFVKQSTSGMFWFSEDVEENLANATIDCLKANNPSYKGYNAMAFGEGDHTLEFKKNKFATYTFSAGSVFVEGEGSSQIVIPTTEEPEAIIVPESEEDITTESVENSEAADEIVADDPIVEDDVPVTEEDVVTESETEVEETKNNNGNNKNKDKNKDKNKNKNKNK